MTEDFEPAWVAAYGRSRPNDADPTVLEKILAGNPPRAFASIGSPEHVGDRPRSCQRSVARPGLDLGRAGTAPPGSGDRDDARSRALGRPARRSPRLPAGRRRERERHRRLRTSRLHPAPHLPLPAPPPSRLDPRKVGASCNLPAGRCGLRPVSRKSGRFDVGSEVLVTAPVVRERRASELRIGDPDHLADDDGVVAGIVLCVRQALQPRRRTDDQRRTRDRRRPGGAPRRTGSADPVHCARSGERTAPDRRPGPRPPNGRSSRSPHGSGWSCPTHTRANGGSSETEENAVAVIACATPSTSGRHDRDARRELRHGVPECVRRHACAIPVLTGTTVPADATVPTPLPIQRTGPRPGQSRVCPPSRHGLRPDRRIDRRPSRPRDKGSRRPAGRTPATRPLRRARPTSRTSGC